MYNPIDSPRDVPLLKAANSRKQRADGRSGGARSPSVNGAGKLRRIGSKKDTALPGRDAMGRKGRLAHETGHISHTPRELNMKLPQLIWKRNGDQWTGKVDGNERYTITIDSDDDFCCSGHNGHTFFVSTLEEAKKKCEIDMLELFIEDLPEPGTVHESVQPPKPALRFKVGNNVKVGAQITDVDNTQYPYRISVGGISIWVTEDDVHPA